MKKIEGIFITQLLKKHLVSQLVVLSFVNVIIVNIKSN